MNSHPIPAGIQIPEYEEIIEGPGFRVTITRHTPFSEAEREKIFWDLKAMVETLKEQFGTRFTTFGFSADDPGAFILNGVRYERPDDE